MGNFSRSTYDPAKNYVSVRLQQGVPLVDADWNELNDVTRFELYNSLATFLPDGVLVGGDLRLDEDTEGILLLNPGTAIIRGRLVKVPQAIQYTKQPWTDAARAAKDGVAVIPPLTPSTSPRTDIAYVDAWDREVTGAEDPNLINPAIGIETCVRLKREVALRVAEGANTPPAAPDGHVYMKVARLVREANQPVNIFSNYEGPALIYGIPGTRLAPIAPAFLPCWNGSLTPNQPYSAWQTTFAGNGTLYAQVGAGNCVGIIPLNLPPGAVLTGLAMYGSSQPNDGVTLTLRRSGITGFGINDIATIAGKGSPFYPSVNITDPTYGLVDSNYSYMLMAMADAGSNAQIRGITIAYNV